MRSLPSSPLLQLRLLLLRLLFMQLLPLRLLLVLPSSFPVARATVGPCSRRKGRCHIQCRLCRRTRLRCCGTALLRQARAAAACSIHNVRGAWLLL